MATLKIQGREANVAETAGLLRSPLHTVEKDRAVRVGAERAGEPPIEIPDAQPDDLVELHLDDGSVVVSTYGWLRERVRQAPGQRGGDADLIPAFLDLGGTERGAGGVALTLLRLFRVEPVREIADLVTERAVAKIEGSLAGPPGLYRVGEDGTLGELVTAPLPASRAPLLVFLHGTASSTMGSFSGLFGERVGERLAPSSEWRALRDLYGDRILALEHHTLSVSPAQNARDLARLLPDGGEVHLVSHSRGGLVGELLCRGGFGAGDLGVFRRGDRETRAPGELALLEELGALLAGKRLRVERFARVACPAAGTVLASDRLDLFLSVLLSLLKHAATPLVEPVLELLQATLLEVARRRADPEELPGLEAQRPESPYAHFLNRPPAEVDQDLCVIAGDLRRGNVLQSLRALVGYGFFWQKNDLVVHTRAMYAGLPRKQAWVSYHESAAVTHFSYFREAASRERLLAAVARPSRATPPAGFQDLREALAKQSFSAMRELPRAERSGESLTGTVLFVPDLFATRLLSAGKETWPSAQELANGGLGALQSGEAVEVGGLVDTSAVVALAQALGGQHEVVPVPYDWRGGSEAAAAALRGALAGRQAGAPPVSVVAHGLGALGVLEVLRAAAQGDGETPLRGVPLLLAAPPLHGSEAALDLWLGQGRLFDMLRCLDPASSASDIAGVLRGLPALAELLPDRALHATSWQEAGLSVPDEESLAGVARRRDEHQAVANAVEASFLLGTAETTPAVVFTEPRRIEPWEEGDGWMVNPVKLLPEARTWYVPALHERVLIHPLGAAAAADLLRSGTTTRAPHQRPKDRPRRQPPPFVFPSQSDLEAELVAADDDAAPATDWVLAVRVAHGSLDRLEKTPILVGHYAGDSIFGAEAFLDLCMEGRLGDRLRQGNYPGPAGSGAFVAAPGCTPPGALVVGLGAVGELTAGVLSSGVERAVLEHALQVVEARRDRKASDPQPVTLPIASLLIGTRGGHLTVRQAMVAILRGVIRARRALALSDLERFVTIRQVTFLELWSDIAIAAGQALLRLSEDAGLGRQPGEQVLPAQTLVVLEGGRENSRAYAQDWSWWRRVIVSEEEAGGARRGLRFVTLGERSRAEERLLFTQRPLVDELLERAPKSSNEGREGLVNALYELLLPVSLKETIFEGRDLVFVVDGETGRYPWELLGRRMQAGMEPLVSRVRVVRQFRTPSFREGSAASSTDDALVIGEPLVSGLAPLAGARREAELVIDVLKGHGLSVESSIGQAGPEIVQKLFLRDYRMLHVAAHGEYKAGKPGESGVIIGRNADGSLLVLSADFFRQLRSVPEIVFLNCCHLGRLDPANPAAAGMRSDAERTRLAASVAEAIMELGVRGLVVAGWAVEDEAAYLFAKEFYARLLRGETFGDAVHEARCAVWSKHARGTTWGAYQCYGDPMFRPRTRRGRAEEQRVFVSARELHGEIADVAAEATARSSSPPYKQLLQERLRALETSLEGHAEWRTGRLLYELAEAWKGVGNLERAVARYRDALEASDAGAPVRAAEQLSNLLDRLVEEGQVSAPRAAPVEAGRPADRLSDAWLTWVDRLGATPERCALRGAMWKRAAQRARSARRQRELYGRAATAYRRGLDLARAAGKPFQYYQGLNVAVLAWLAGTADQATLDELVAPSREAAAAERAQGRTLWNLSADCDADLLEDLVLDRLSEPRASALAARYAEALQIGSRADARSVRSQIALLRRRAVGERARLAPLLDIVLEVFPKE